MSLYNVKMEINGDLKITKFTDDLEPEYTDGKLSSYITSGDACDCPAGHRDTCRHRQMLPEFLSTNRVNTAWMYDHDNQAWYYYDAGSGKLLDHEPIVTKRGTIEHGLRRRI